MLSVSSEPIQRGAPAAFPSPRPGDDNTKPASSGFADLVVPEDRTDDRPQDQRADRTKASVASDAGRGKPSPAPPEKPAQPANDNGSGEGPGSVSAAPDTTANDTTSAKSVSSDPALAAVLAAAAAKSDSEASPTATQKDSTTSDNTTGDATTGEAPAAPTIPTLPALVIAAVVPPVANPAVAATAPPAQDKSASPSVPGAIAAAAVMKVAAEIAGSEPPARPGGENATASPPSTGGAADSPAADPKAADASVVAQLPVQPAPASTDQIIPPPSNGVAAEVATAANGAVATAATTSAVPVSAANTGKVAQGSLQQLLHTGFVPAPSTQAPAAETNGTASDPTDPAALSAKTKPLTAAQPEAGKAAPAAEKSPDDAAADKPIIIAHHATIGAEPKLASASQPSDLTTTTAQIQQATGLPAANQTTSPSVEVAAATVTSSAATPLNALAVEISAHARAGNTRFEIRLDPPDLGRIDVRLDVDRSGQVTSRLFVEKSETLDLLRRDAPQLQQALHDAGLKTSDNGLQFSLRDQTGQGRSDGQGSQQNNQRLIIVEDEPTAPQAAGRSYGRTLTFSGGVDIKV